MAGLSNNVVDEGAFDFLDHIFEPEFALFELLELEQIHGAICIDGSFYHLVQRLMLVLVLN